MSHKWDPRRVRADPDAAFDVFDVNKDGVITVSELCFVSRHLSDEVRKEGSLLAELDIFHTLDMDGDAVITRAEFCHVVSNPKIFSDEALNWISRWCATVDGTDSTLKLDNQNQKLEAFTATAGIVQGMRLHRATKQQPPPEKKKKKPAGVRLEDVELELELVALGVRAVDLVWYDFVGVTNPYETHAYVVLLANNVEVARSLVVERDPNTSSVAWNRVTVPTHKLTNMLTDDLPSNLVVKLYAAQSFDDDILLGESKPFPLVPPDSLSSTESAIGPLLAFDDQEELGSKIIGTQKWVPAGTARRRAKPNMFECTCLNF